MRDQMAERIRELGAVPDVEVILDDSWSTGPHHARGPREAARRLHLLPLASPVARSSSSCRARRSSARTAARPRRGSRTSSARRRAGRCATARAAASRSSSSRRSESVIRWLAAQGLPLISSTSRKATAITSGTRASRRVSARSRSRTMATHQQLRPPSRRKPIAAAPACLRRRQAGGRRCRVPAAHQPRRVVGKILSGGRLLPSGGAQLERSSCVCSLHAELHTAYVERIPGFTQLHDGRPRKWSRISAPRRGSGRRTGRWQLIGAVPTSTSSPAKRRFSGSAPTIPLTSSRVLLTSAAFVSAAEAACSSGTLLEIR